MVKKKEDLDILDDLVLTTLLQSAECHIEPLMRQNYYLYKRVNGTCFISLVEPEYWNTDRFSIKFISLLHYTSEGEWEPVAV